MTHRILTLLVATLLLPGFGAASDSPEVVVTDRYERSLRGTVDGFPFILLRGTQEQRGEAHGVLAAREAIRCCDNALGFLQKAGVERQRALAVLEQFDFPERFRLELKALLGGIRKSLPDPADRQLPSLGKEIDLEDLMILQTIDILEMARCSQFSAWGDRTPDSGVVVGRNLDYPAVWPREAACVMAVVPDEEGLRSTMDAVWFGTVGGGIVSLREDGLYIAPNAGGRAVKDGSLKNPVPGSLLLRQVAERAPGVGTVDWLIEAMAGKIIMPAIIHVVPAESDTLGHPVVIEYTPAGSTVRGPVDGQEVLYMANHFVREDEDLAAGRSGKMRASLQSCADLDAQIGFAQARDVIHSANQGASTYYSMVIWPSKRTMRVALGKPGASATESRFAVVPWDAIFELE